MLVWTLFFSLFFVNFAVHADVGPSPLVSPSPSPSSSFLPGPRDFQKDVERDFPLRTSGTLTITNLRGGIQVQGWSLDKIRVIARKHAVAQTEEEASDLLKAVEFRYQTHGGEIELSAEYGQGLDLAGRLKEHSDPHTDMEMMVYAPSKFPLRIWTVNGRASLKSWNSSVEIRTANGSISIENVKGSGVSLLCPTCSIDVKSVQSSLRCMGGSGSIHLDQVSGGNVYVETDGGALDLTRIRGDQLYVSKSGAIRLNDTHGDIEFHTHQAPVTIENGYGSLSGRTDSGTVSAVMREWKFSDKSLLESQLGSITLGVPYSFSGDVDLGSGGGKVKSEFSIEQPENEEGPPSSTHLVGRVGYGGETLKIFSEKGDVSLLKIY